MDNNGYRLLLPEGTLDYFIISDVKESASEIVIYLEEKNEVPKEYAGMKVESINKSVNCFLLLFILG